MLKLRDAAFAAKRAIGLFGTAVFLTAAATAPALAEYPEKPITLLVPWAPGGSTDTLSRIVAKKMGDLLGQPILVENKPGAGGSIGTRIVATSKNDGYLITLGTPSTHAIWPATRATVPYDPIKDFTSIALLAVYPFPLLCNPEVPVKNLQELVDYAKKKDTPLKYGSHGVGSHTHLMFADLSKKLGFPSIHIPYTGGSQIATETMAGRVDCSFEASSRPLVDAGKLRAIALSGMEHSDIYPGVLTIDESGLPGTNFIGWQSLMAPAGVPADVVEKLYKTSVEALSDPEVVKAIESLGLGVETGTPQELQELLERDVKIYKEIAESAGIVVNE